MKRPSVKLLVLLIITSVCLHVAMVMQAPYPHRAWHIPFAGGVFADQAPDFRWADDDVVECSSHQDCIAKFDAAVSAADALADDARPEAPYLAYMHLKRAGHLLASSDVQGAELDEFRARVRPQFRELEQLGDDTIYVAHWANKRALYTRASGCVKFARDRFPDDRARYGRWASETQRQMKASKTWLDDEPARCPAKDKAPLP